MPNGKYWHLIEVWDPAPEKGLLWEMWTPYLHSSTWRYGTWDDIYQWFLKIPMPDGRHKRLTEVGGAPIYRNPEGTNP